MPFINISLAGSPLSDMKKQQLFDETTRLMHDVLNKNPDLTSVRIDEFSAQNWAVARRPMSERGETAVHMDIKVTKGTNSDEEKAQMIAQGMAMLKDIIGTTPEASYIVIHDIEGGSWGYDGRTQQDRVGQTA
jgi:4-oxalocrotonate tautomerase